MNKPIILYVKTHNITGLKYFGKTIQDPEKYKGSGVRWLRHIKKHGYDVTTEIIGTFLNEDECRNFAIQFSIDNNIVNSPEWANLKQETIDGGFDHINHLPKEERINFIILKEKIANGEISVGGVVNWSEESKQKVVSQALKNLEQFRQEIKNGSRSANRWEEYPEEKAINIKNKISASLTGNKNGNYGKVWCVKETDTDYSNKKLFLKNSIPTGWISTTDFKNKNKNKNSPSYGKHWYNDGIKNYYLYPSDEKIITLNLEKRRLTINNCCGFTNKLL